MSPHTDLFPEDQLIRDNMLKDLEMATLCLTSPFHRIAARLRFGTNPQGLGWAANGERAR